MAGLNFDVNGARQAGYSDDEIVQHIAGIKDSGFDVNGALKAGYSPTEILAHVAPQQSGIWDSLRQGTADALEGAGSTIKTYAGEGYGGDTLVNAGKAVEPENFVASPLVDKQGFHAGNIPAWLARQAPTVAGSIVAAGLAPEALGTAGAIGAGAGAGWLMSAGNEAKEAAVNRTGDPNAVPTTADKVRGGLTSAAESTVGALPITRFIPGVKAPLTSTGVSGVVDAAKKLATTAGEQSAASAGADVAHQVGQTVGTPGGTTVEPSEVANAAVGGAVQGGAFGARNAARDALDAIKYSDVTPELKTAATQFANRMAANAGGVDNLVGGLVRSGPAQRAGKDALVKATDAVNNELGDAVNDLRSRVTLPTDADNALKSVMGGRLPTARDYSLIQNAVAGDPQADNVMNLLRQAHVASIVQDTGHMSGDKFTGGLAGGLKHIVSGEHALKTGLAAVGGAAFEGGAGHIIAFSPEVLGTAGGAMVAARLFDNLTKAQTPAGRFVRNFADGQTPVRVGVPQPQEAGSPSQDNAPQAPLPGPPRPWSSPLAAQAVLAGKRQAGIANAAEANAMPLLRQLAATGVDPKAVLAAQMKDATDLMAARRANAALAARTAPVPGPAAPLTSGPPMAGGPSSAPMIPPAVRAQMAARANLARLAAAQRPEEAATPVAAPLNPNALPTSITGPAKAIMRGAALAQKLQDKQPTVQMRDASQLMAARAANAKLDEGEGEEQGPSEQQMLREQMNDAKELMAARKANKALEAASAPKPVNVTKANGQTKVGDEPFPRSSYAHMTPEEAAEAVTREKSAQGLVTYRQGYKRAVVARITGERTLMSRLAAEAPDLPIAELTARFEGRSTPADARAFRDHLKTAFPAAASAIDKVITDEAIKGLWQRK